MTSRAALLSDNSLPEQPVATKPSRHRRVRKEIGAVTGITFIDHPQGPAEGVVVSQLSADGACAKSGVRIGDHITKINGTRPSDRSHAVELCDAAWTAEAREGDKNTDRLKFSLHRRTQDFSIGKKQTNTLTTAPLSMNATVGVEVMGGAQAKKGLLGGALGGKPLEPTGLTLEDSPAGYGALIAAVTPDSLAHVAGLEPGLTIISVDGALCEGGAKPVAKLIDAARSKRGAASVVCHLKKSKEDEQDHV
jgi:S1-C subfamily serine protease